MKTKLKIAVIYGSVREGRQGIKAAHFVVNQLKKRGHEVTFIDPLEYNLPLLQKRYKEYEKGKAPDNLQQLHDIFESVDAVIVVSGEYNHSIPPALSNLLDYFTIEFHFKPSAIVSYSAGIFGGVRAAMQLRAMLAEIGMPSIPKTFPIGKIQEVFDEKGNDITPQKEYVEKFPAFIEQLEWYAEAMKDKREKINSSE
ncbi:MAG: FMN-dependent NADPH-azoreductase [archaeon]|jgi:NAD(P)H-dependent FMN reductase